MNLLRTDGSDGGPAFPLAVTADTNDYFGMSLRDWFAGQALAAAFHDGAFEPEGHYEALAAELYEMADAMLRARGGE